MDSIAVLTPDLVGFLDMGTPVERAVKAWLIGHREPTRTGYARDIQIYLAWCEEAGLDPLAAKRVHLQVYAEWLQARGWSSATASSRFCTVSSFYKACLRDELIPKNPCEFVNRPKIDVESQKRPALSPLALGIYLHAAEQVGVMEYALLCLLGLRGLRISEACDLDVSSIRFERGYWRVRGVGKNRKPYDLPLPFRASEAVQAAIDEREEGPLLLTKWRTRMTRNAAQRCIDRVAAVAHRDDYVTPHALRRSFVGGMLAAGAQPADVQDAARHSNISTTMLYDRRQRTASRDASHVLGGFLDGTRG